MPDIKIDCVVRTKSKIFPLIWVELVTCCVKFQLKMKSQKIVESLVEPVRDDQHIPGRLKSPQIKDEVTENC